MIIIRGTLFQSHFPYSEVRPRALKQKVISSLSSFWSPKHHCIKAKGNFLLFLLLVPEASLQEVWAGCLWEVQQQALQLPCHGLWVPGPRLRFLLWLHQGRGVSVCLSLSFCVSICSGRAWEMIQVHGWPLNNARVRGAALRVVDNLGIKRVGPSYPRFCGSCSVVVFTVEKTLGISGPMPLEACCSGSAVFLPTRLSLS